MKAKLKRIGKTVLNALGVLITAFLAIIVCMNLYSVVSQKIFKVKCPTVFGYYGAVVMTGSMSGTIEPNDMVITKASGDYNIGDVVMFKSGAGTVTHRIVDIKDGKFQTKGDANDIADLDMILPESVVGRVVAVIPGVGAIIGFLTSPAGMLCLLAALVLMIEIPRICRTYFERKKGADCA